MKTTVVFNNSRTDFEQATIKALKRLFGYCKVSQKYSGEYEISDWKRAQVCPVGEYRNLIETDSIFRNAVNRDGIEDGVIIFKDYLTKKTEKYIVLIQ